MIHDELTREEKLEQLVNWIRIALCEWQTWCQMRELNHDWLTTVGEEKERIESMITLIERRVKRLDWDPLASWRRMGA